MTPSAPASAPARPCFVALVGNPNVGKSSLFNALTGLRQKVANYAGVTVDAMEGEVRTGGGPLRLVDLPGAYSLDPKSADEAVVERVLCGPQAQPCAALADLGEIGGPAERPDAVLVALDATNLRRNLFFLSEVIDLGLPVVVALNMVDEARRGGLEVPSARLGAATGIQVLETVASRGEGVADLRQALVGVERRPVPARTWRFEDPALEERLAATPGASVWERLRALRAADPAVREAEVAARYAWVNAFLTGGAGGQDTSRLRARTERIDALLLHPVAGPLIFVLIMGLVFQSVFAWAGPLMEGLKAAVAALGEWAAGALPPLIGAQATSLVVDGAIGGVGSVVVFLPQIVILFFFIGLLEDTGYMARAAFLVDRPLRTVGLSGRSFIPLLSSFACAIPGVMAARTISSRSERLLAILVAPLMTCSARLPVYALLIAAFVPDRAVAGVLGLQGLVLLGLYVSGMAGAALVAFVIGRLQRRRVRGKPLPLVVELPPYRRPLARSVLLKLRIRAGDFLRRAGTVIFAITLVLWALAAYPSAYGRPPEGPAEKAHQLEQSYAGRIGHAIEPAIRPLGYDWKVGIGLVASFAAREVFVATMGVVYGLGDVGDEEMPLLEQRLQAEVDPATGRPVFGLPTVLSLLAFYVFALQCGSTVAVVRRETGSWRFALGQLALFGALAWSAAFVVYRVALALGL